jgi:hypothetical protein
MEDTIESLRAKLKVYEENGPAKLYYALSRKMWEMADLLNATNLKALDLGDPKDKTFDRLKVIWNDSSSISAAVQALGIAIGATGSEDKDIDNRRRITTPESMANVLGNTAGQQD